MDFSTFFNVFPRLKIFLKIISSCRTLCCIEGVKKIFFLKYFLGQRPGHMLKGCVKRVQALQNLSGCGVLSVPGAGSGTLSAATRAPHRHSLRSADLGNPACLIGSLRSPWLRLLSGVRYDNAQSRRRRYSTAGDGRRRQTVDAAVDWLLALENGSHPWHANAWLTRQASAAPRYGKRVDGARDGNNFLVPQIDWLRGVRCGMQIVYVVCADAADDWAWLKHLTKTEGRRVNARNYGDQGKGGSIVDWAQSRVEEDLYWPDTQLWRWVCGGAL